MPVRGLLVLARDPHADRRGLALVHRRADHAAGVEGELQVAERRVLGEPAAQLRHILLGRFLAFGGKLDLDHGVHRAGVGRVGRRPVRRHADLGEDELEVFLVDRLANELLDGRDALLGLLDSQPRGGPHIHLEGAGVDLGEELLAEHRPEERDRQRQQAEADRHGLEPIPQHDVECLDVVRDARVDRLLPAVEDPSARHSWVERDHCRVPVTMQIPPDVETACRHCRWTVRRGRRVPRCHAA